MAPKIIYILLATVLLGCATAPKPNLSSTNEQKYAISFCLAQSYPSTPMAADAIHVAGGYLDKGSHGIDMYEGIREYVLKYKSTSYLSKENKNLSIMQCLDLFESKELKNLINQSGG
jgi:hypothetical protein